MKIIFLTCCLKISASNEKEYDNLSPEEWNLQHILKNIEFDAYIDVTDFENPVKINMANENELNVCNFDTNAHDNVVNSDVNKEINETGICVDSDSVIYRAIKKITNNTEDTGQDICENTKELVLSDSLASKSTDNKNTQDTNYSDVNPPPKQISVDLKLKTGINSEITNLTNTHDNKNNKCIFNAEEILFFIKEKRKKIIDSDKCVPSKKEIRMYNCFLNQQINKYGEIKNYLEAFEKLMADYILERKKRINFYNENGIFQREIKDYIAKKETGNCYDKNSRDILMAKTIVNYVQNRTSDIIFHQNSKPSCQECIDYIANTKHKLTFLGCVLPDNWPSNNERDEILKIIECEIQNFNLIKISEKEIEDSVKKREESFGVLKEEEYGAVLDEEKLCAKEDVNSDENQDKDTIKS